MRREIKNQRGISCRTRALIGHGGGVGQVLPHLYAVGAGTQRRRQVGLKANNQSLTGTD